MWWTSQVEGTGSDYVTERGTGSCRSSNCEPRGGRQVRIRDVRLPRLHDVLVQDAPGRVASG